MHKTDATSEHASDLVLMAEIVGVHGIKGWLKLKIFSADPANLADFAPFYDATQTREFKLAAIHPHGNNFLAVIEGVNNRDTAEALRGTKLYLPRTRLPDIEEEDTFYHVDLIGMAAQWPDGRPMGTVVNVVNFGAGDLLEVRPPRGSNFFIPFTNEIVPDVNMSTKIVTIDPPPGLID